MEFTAGDVYDLPFEDESWDVVHAHQLLQHLADPVAALKQMHRVVRPGGVVAVRDSDYATFTWYPVRERLQRWLRLYQAIARANGGEPDAGPRLLAWARLLTAGLRWCMAKSSADGDGAMREAGQHISRERFTPGHVSR